MGQRAGGSGLCVHKRPILSSLGDGGTRSVLPVTDRDLDCVLRAKEALLSSCYPLYPPPCLLVFIHLKGLEDLLVHLF